MRCLVCFAVEAEAAPFRGCLILGSNVRTLVTGMGRRHALTAVSKALDEFQPELVLACGFAGGLNAKFVRGVVVFDCADQTDLARALLAAGAQPARFCLSDRVVGTVAEKSALARISGADVVDMESSAILDLGQQRQVRSAAVRVILDGADEDLPLDFNSLLTPELKLDGRKLFIELCKHPGGILRLLKLRGRSREAARKLARVLEQVLVKMQAGNSQ